MDLAKKFLASQRLSFKEVTLVESMPNLISTARISKNGRHLLFSGHLDVLPAGNKPGWNEDPWS